MYIYIERNAAYWLFPIARLLAIPYWLFLVRYVDVDASEGMVYVSEDAGLSEYQYMPASERKPKLQEEPKAQEEPPSPDTRQCNSKYICNYIYTVYIYICVTCTWSPDRVVLASWA